MLVEDLAEIARMMPVSDNDGKFTRIWHLEFSKRCNKPGPVFRLGVPRPCHIIASIVKV